MIKIETVENLLHIRNTRNANLQALNHNILLNKTHYVIKINQETWFEQYTDMNT